MTHYMHLLRQENGLRLMRGRVSSCTNSLNESWVTALLLAGSM